MVQNLPVPMQRIGVRDTIAESGPYLELIDKCGFTARHIVKAAERVLDRNRSP